MYVVCADSVFIWNSTEASAPLKLLIMQALDITITTEYFNITALPVF